MQIYPAADIAHSRHDVGLSKCPCTKLEPVRTVAYSRDVLPFRSIVGSKARITCVSSNHAAAERESAALHTLEFGGLELADVLASLLDNS